MQNDYISLRKYAEVEGKSVQAIYHELKKKDSPLNAYLEYRNGKKVFNIKILDQKKEAEIKEDTNKEETINNNDFDIINELKEQITFLREQITKKDETIDILHNTIKEQLFIINNSQQLMLVEKTANGKVIIKDNEQVEEKTVKTEEEEEAESIVVGARAEEQHTKGKKRSLFSFFKK